MPQFANPATNAEMLGLEHLHAFLAFVETGSQVRAAKRLRVAQATVSRHIDRVQQHFGGGLFEAAGNGRLSTRGLLVEQSVRAAMAELARTRDRLAVDRPVLRIGFIRLVRPLIERALRGRTETHAVPAFDVRLLEMTTDDLSRGLKRRELDIAICYALPELATHQGVEESLVTEQPFALVIPAPAWVHGKPSVRVLKSLLYARLPHHFAHRAVVAGEKWLTQHQVTPRQTIECALGTEIVSYAAAGLGYGFLPALWSTVADASVVFAPMTNFAATAKIAAYSLQHVAPWVTQLREDLSVGARAALQDFAPSRGR